MAVSDSPSGAEPCPWAFSPQHMGVPSSRSAQVWNAPLLRVLYRTLGTSVGVGDGVGVGVATVGVGVGDATPVGVSDGVRVGVGTVVGVVAVEGISVGVVAAVAVSVTTVVGTGTANDVAGSSSSQPSAKSGAAKHSSAIHFRLRVRRFLQYNNRTVSTEDTFFLRPHATRSHVPLALDSIC